MRTAFWCAPSESGQIDRNMSSVYPSSLLPVVPEKYASVFARAFYPPKSVTWKILPSIRIRLIPVKTTILIQVNARAKADG